MERSPEEVYCIFMLDELRKSYEKAAQPYIDRLAKIDSMRMPTITAPIEMLNAHSNQKTEGT